MATRPADPFKNDVIRGKALTFVSLVLNEFPPDSIYKSLNWLHIGTKGVNNLEMSSESTLGHEETAFHSASTVYITRKEAPLRRNAAVYAVLVQVIIAVIIIMIMTMICIYS